MEVVVETEESGQCPKVPSIQNNAKGFICFKTRSSENSTVAESKVFMLQVIFTWIIICIPGNIFAFTVFYKHYYIRKDKHIIHPGENESNATLAVSTGQEILSLLNGIGHADIDSIQAIPKSILLVSIFNILIRFNLFAFTVCF